jgi:hypothetical protein
MKDRIIFIAFCFVIFSCKNRIHDGQSKKDIEVTASEIRTNLNTRNDSLLVDSIYGPHTWDTYFKPHKTPSGAIIKLTVINDSLYLIQWGDSIHLHTYQEIFYLDGHESWIPSYKDENKDYILLYEGCGNPCWVGYFLPKTDRLSTFEAHEYLGYDLDKFLVAYVKDTNIIEVYNLKTRQIEDHIINGCVSAFPGYCIDSLKIKNGYLTYKWFPIAEKESNKSVIKREKIKI